MRPRSRAISARRSCSSSAERLMMRASSPSSSSRLTRMRAARLPLASWRAVSMISPSDRPRPTDSSSDTSPLAASATRPASAALRHSARPCASIRSMPRLSRATPTTAPARWIGTAAYSRRTPTVELTRSARETWPARAPTTSERPPWFSTAARSAPDKDESASTRPSVPMIVTRASTSRAAASTRPSSSPFDVPRARASSTTRAIRRASAVRLAKASSRARRSRVGLATSSSTPSTTAVATSAVITMRPRKDSLRLTSRSPARNDIRAI